MIDALTIDRNTGNGRYSDVLDVLERLGKGGQYGSATNAAVQLIRKTSEFQETLAQIGSGRKPAKQPKAV